MAIPDILISEDAVFTWYESLGKDGFASARRAPKSWDEEKGPKLVFADSTQSIFLADMVGDGLSDIVRIRCGEICYWPNLGYGRFGAKVTMGNAPVFDTPDLFDPRRIHLADIDGSGNSDIIYVGVEGVSLYFNQSGNSWSPARRLAQLSARRQPHLDRADGPAGQRHGVPRVVVAAGGRRRRPMRYIDLMGGQKPHLLVHTTNNMGVGDRRPIRGLDEILSAGPSGRPSLGDEAAVPGPRHRARREPRSRLQHHARQHLSLSSRLFRRCRARIPRFRLSSSSGTSESVVGDFDLPPVVTKTWFHNGAFLEEGALEAYFKDPANQEFFAGDRSGRLSCRTPICRRTSPARKCVRPRARLKGSILRQEVYADDGSAKAALPYSVSERSYKLTCLQPRGPEPSRRLLQPPERNHRLSLRAQSCRSPHQPCADACGR